MFGTLYSILRADDMTKQLKRNEKPTFAVQVVCIISLVLLALIDGFFQEFEVNTIVYAIIAGVLFGIGNLKHLIGGGK